MSQGFWKKYFQLCQAFFIKTSFGYLWSFILCEIQGRRVPPKIRAPEIRGYGHGYRVHQGRGGFARFRTHTPASTHWRTANGEFVRRLPTGTHRRRHTQRERQPNRGGTPYIYIDTPLLILRSWASRLWKWPGKSAARIRMRPRGRCSSTSRAPPRASASLR